MKKQLLCFVLTVAMIFTMISHTVVATGEENPSDPMVVDSSATSESETSAETSSTAETEAPAETSSTAETEVPAETSTAVETEAPAETSSTAETEAPAETSSTAETEAPAETSSTAETEAPAETSSSNESSTPEETTSATESSTPEETTSASGESIAESTVYVAESNGVQYTSIQTAIDEATDGEKTTITLLTDVTLVNKVLTIPPTKKIVLELNKHTITGIVTPDFLTSEYIKEEKGYRVIGVSQEFNDDKTATATDEVTGEFIYAELTIQNGTVVCDYTQSNLTQGTIDYAIDTVRNHGELTIINATIENKSVPGQLGFAVDNHSGYATTYVTIENSTIKASGSDYCEGIRQYDVEPSYHNEIHIDSKSTISSVYRQDRTDVDHPLSDTVAKTIYVNQNGQDNVIYSMTIGSAFNPNLSGVTVKKIIILKDQVDPTGFFSVNPGVTLDLNGKTVSCMMVIVMSGMIVDSLDGEGCLIATHGLTFMSSPNWSQMPLYDKDVKGYRFFYCNVQFSYNDTKYAPDWCFLAQMNFENADAYNLLATGESRITFGCDVSFQKSGSEEKIKIPHWQIETGKVQEYAAMALSQIAAGKTPTATLGVQISDLGVIAGGKLHIEIYVESVIGVPTTGFVKSSGLKTLNVK